MHILIVEDEKVLCDTIVRSLKHLSYSVDYCHDGQTAIDMLAVDHFDLVVLDLNLPRKDGMSVLKALRENHFIWKNWPQEYVLLHFDDSHSTTSC